MLTRAGTIYRRERYVPKTPSIHPVPYDHRSGEGKEGGDIGVCLRQGNPGPFGDGSSERGAIRQCPAGL